MEVSDGYLKRKIQGILKLRSIESPEALHNFIGKQIPEAGITQIKRVLAPITKDMKTIRPKSSRFIIYNKHEV